jgi:beta-1,4-N-acetylglucosaminyltransferase
MIVLGSGGHTSEMFKFIDTLPMDRKHIPRVYVIANSDVGSASTLSEFEQAKSPNKVRHSVRYIPRSRVVGQSYITSVFSTLYSFIHCALVVWQERPTVLLANGPGTCLPILMCAWIYRTIGIAPCTIFLLESYACVSHQSLTAKLCKPFVDRYCVQWPQLLNPSQPHIVYTGRIPLNDFSPAATRNTNVIGASSNSYVLVTVGSTLFNSLIAAIDNPEIIPILKKAGFTGLHVQYGKGHAPTQLQSVLGFEVVLYDYKKLGWKEEIANAALVIGHAGAGTILDSLEASKPIIVVANDLLMSQHQAEIAQQMKTLGHLFSSTPGRLMSDLPSLLPRLQNLKTFPPHESSSFASELSKFLNQGKNPTFVPRNISKRRSLRLEGKA